MVDPPGSPVKNRIVFALAWWLIGSVPFIVGATFGHSFIERQGHPFQQQDTLLNAFAPWDGVWYEQIVDEGYSYNPDVASSTAFFPGLPAAGYLVQKVTGLPTVASLLLVSQLSLLGSFMLLRIYLEHRGDQSAQNPNLFYLIPAVFALFPTTYAWHFAYSESLFLLSLLGAFTLMSRKAHVAVVAVVVGFATCVRPTGVILFLPLVIYIYERTQNWKRTLGTAVLIAPIAFWGLLNYMAYQWVEFQTPFAFAQTQELWARQPPLHGVEKLVALVTLEPVWSVYVPSYPGYWEHFELPRVSPLFSMYFANPIYFVLAVVLVAIGGYKRWLNSKELALSIGLLVFTYAANSHEAMMQSQARYASVVFPALIVCAELLHRSPRWLQLLAAVISIVLLLTYSALMASWYRVC